MKVPGSTRRIYEESLETMSRLKVVVDQAIKVNLQPRWHYESRLKELQSFALKIETGRVQKPSLLEDFFACTVVVANFSEVSAAEAVCLSLFDEAYRRPKEPAKTSKRPSSFEFDDLRLYMRLKAGPDRNTDVSLAGCVFEVQIKTYLQHAWSIATHDLIYKTSTPNWASERVAFQVKALLEHAELAISEATSLSASPLIALQNHDFSIIANFIAVVDKHWAAEELPKDKKRLAENIAALCKALKVDANRLDEVLDAERAAQGGSHPLNISPYGTVLQYIAATDRTRLEDFLREAAAREPRTGLYFSEEVELPDGLAITSGMPGVIVSE